MKKNQHTWLKAICTLCVVCVVGFVMTQTTTVKAATKVSPQKATLCVGENKQLKVSGVKGEVKWSSSKSKVASVNKKGLVTAKKKGSCVITAKVNGKNYKSKITVKKLPKNYATVNGKKVKVGSKVKITYSIKSKTPIACISIMYFYDRKGIQVTNEYTDNRFPTWLENEGIMEYISEEGVCDLHHLWGFSEKDPYNPADISCKKAKIVDNMELKVLKGGNYTIQSKFYNISRIGGIEVKNYTITQKIK